MSEPVAALSIIVPAFREAPNLDPLVRRVFAELGAAGLAGEMIIVDDDSNDGTEALAARLAAEFPVRILVRRGRRGLASAVLEGFELARNDVLVVMDADLQHPPEALPRLVEPILQRRADLVFGTRYAEGAAIVEGWTLARRLNSWLATLSARPLIRLSDPMSGFFAIEKATWRRSARLNPIGYKIGLELAVKCRGARLAEVPIRFATRHAGTSKLSLKEQWRYTRHLARLYWFAWPRVLLVIATGLTLVVVMGLLARSE